MDDKRLAEIKAREQAATKGPWMMAMKPEYDGYWITADRCVGGPTGEYVYDRSGGVFRVDETIPPEAIEQGHDAYEEICAPYGGGDAEFVAHARQDIPDLLAALEAERERAEKLEQALDRIANDHATQVEYAARDDWHGLFNWAQDVAKDALSEKE